MGGGSSFKNLYDRVYFIQSTFPQGIFTGIGVLYTVGVARILRNAASAAATGWVPMVWSAAATGWVLIIRSAAAAG